MSIRIEIDEDSGFCFGVVNAIHKAEKQLKQGETLYCLGDIVHNSLEVERLKNLGLITINHQEYKNLSHKKVLFRAHGEPPSTYETSEKESLEIIDATCPVVLQLQKKIKQEYQRKHDSGCQIVIYGKQGHAEVLGLVGQTNGEAIVVEHSGELDKIDFNKDISLFSQTTKPLDGFMEMVAEIEKRISPDCSFKYHDTICRQVANRIPNIRNFAAAHDLIFFVSGKKSSNGKMLFEECLRINPNTHFIECKEDIDTLLLTPKLSVGICGATSTPKWLMQEIYDYIKIKAAELFPE